jgi:hypothetical protein
MIKDFKEIYISEIVKAWKIQDRRFLAKSCAEELSRCHSAARVVMVVVI